MPYRRKKQNQGVTSENKTYKTKRRKRDIDQIVDDLEPTERLKLENQPFDFDLPGGGQFYCIHCAKHCITSQALQEHKRSKAHKKRVKETAETPYSVEESERAGGLGSYAVQPKSKKRKLSEMMEDQPVA